MREIGPMERDGPIKDHLHKREPKANQLEVQLDKDKEEPLLNQEEHSQAIYSVASNNNNRSKEVLTLINHQCLIQKLSC